MTFTFGVSLDTNFAFIHMHKGKSMSSPPPNKVVQGA